MRLTFVAALAASFLALTPAAHADVKTGVDAWNQGDYAGAVNEWRPLAIAGNADAQFNLGQAYKLGRGVAVDLPVSLEWFRKASEQGHEKAVDNYGLLLFQQGRREEAIPYIRASAERGEPRAQYVYGTALFNGDLAPRDWVRAYALMTRASQAGVGQATTSLAQMDQFIPEDQRKAGVTLASAMAQGRAPKAPDAATLAQADAPPMRASAPAPRAAPAPRPPRESAPVITPSTPIQPTVIAADGPAARPPVRKSDPRSRPAAAPAAVPVPAPASTGRYRVQLGAFRVSGSAQALWKSLNGKVGGLSVYQPTYLGANGLTRLLVGPLGSADDARRLCARITPTGTPCVVQGM